MNKENAELLYFVFFSYRQEIIYLLQFTTTFSTMNSFIENF